MFFGASKALGLDIGTNSIKMVELKKSGKNYKLIKFGRTLLPEGLIEGGEIQDPAALGEMIAGLHQELGIKTKTVCTGIFGGAVIVKKISIPRIEEKLVAEQIKWEAEQYIPFELSEVNLDFHILGTDTSSETMDLLLVAAKHDYVLRYFEAMAVAGLSCSVMDVSGFALANCFEANYGTRQGETIALINIGCGVTTLVILDRGEVVFCRDIPIGGALYNSEISRELGVTPSEAEELKLGASYSEESPPELLSILTQTNEIICEEIRNSFEFYMSSNTGPEVSDIFITGGSSNIRQLVEAIAVSTGKSCQVFNPFQAFSGNPKTFTPDYLNEIQSFLPIVLGLAMRKKGDS